MVSVLTLYVVIVVVKETVLTLFAVTDVSFDVLYVTVPYLTTVLSVYCFFHSEPPTVNNFSA